MQADLWQGQKTVLEIDPVTRGYKLVVNSPYVEENLQFTGQITGTVANTPQTGPNISGTNGFLVVAHPDNTDTVWVMSSAQTKANAYPLQAGGSPTILSISNLNKARFDVDVNGEKICWIKI